MNLVLRENNWTHWGSYWMTEIANIYKGWPFTVWLQGSGSIGRAKQPLCGGVSLIFTCHLLYFLAFSSFLLQHVHIILLILKEGYNFRNWNWRMGSYVALCLLGGLEMSTLSIIWNDYIVFAYRCNIYVSVCICVCISNTLCLFIYHLSPYHLPIISVSHLFIICHLHSIIVIQSISMVCWSQLMLIHGSDRYILRSSASWLGLCL